VATTPTRLMTFAEYEKIPNPPGGRYELYHGELVNVAYPLFPHVRTQWQLRRLLEKAAGDAGVVEKEMPFRPLPEHECWSADVAFISKARWDSIDRYLLGAPDLVVEVLSPSNTAAEMLDKRNVCLENGSREFWVVDADHRQVEVSTPDGRTMTYKAGQEIPLLFGGRLAVSAIFSTEAVDNREKR
jgi:Uma2 family endonuclease